MCHMYNLCWLQIKWLIINLSTSRMWAGSKLPTYSRSLHVKFSGGFSCVDLLHIWQNILCLFLFFFQYLSRCHYFYSITLRCLETSSMLPWDRIHFSHISFSSLPWTLIDSLSQACSINKNYSCIDGWEGALINVTFATNNPVIVSKPNKMRIWLCVRLIITSTQESRRYTVLLIMSEDGPTQSISTANDILLFFMCYESILQRKPVFVAPGRPLIRWTQFLEHLITGKKKHVNLSDTAT